MSVLFLVQHFLPWTTITQPLIWRQLDFRKFLKMTKLLELSKCFLKQTVRAMLSSRNLKCEQFA